MPTNASGGMPLASLAVSDHLVEEAPPPGVGINPASKPTGLKCFQRHCHCPAVGKEKMIPELPSPTQLLPGPAPARSSAAMPLSSAPQVRNLHCRAASRPGAVASQAGKAKSAGVDPSSSESQRRAPGRVPVRFSRSQPATAGGLASAC